MSERSEAIQAFSTAYVAEAIRLSEDFHLKTPEEKTAWYNRLVAGHGLGLSLFKMSLETDDQKKEN